MRGSRDFCQSYLVLSLFYSLQRGSNGFIAEKIILILYQGSKGVHYFPGGGGVSNFFQGGGGVQMLISLETNVRTCYFPDVLVIFQGWGCPDPLFPSGSAHRQCHHNGTIFITVPLHNCQALICQD